MPDSEDTEIEERANLTHGRSADYFIKAAINPSLLSPIVYFVGPETDRYVRLSWTNRIEVVSCMGMLLIRVLLRTVGCEETGYG